MACVPDLDMDGPLDEEELANVEDDTVEEESSDNVVRGMPFRWTHRSRILMVKKMLATLTSTEVSAIIEGKRWPNNPPKFNKAYLEMYLEVSTDLMNRYPGVVLEQDPQKLKDDKAIRRFQDAAREWTTRFLQTGTIHNQQPHKKGYKLEQRRPHLNAIRDMIMRGYQRKNAQGVREGETRLFRDLHHLQREMKDEFKPLMEATGLKTMRSLWHQLKLVHPNLAKVTVKMKKNRDTDTVQACSLANHCSDTVQLCHHNMYMSVRCLSAIDLAM